MSLEEVTTIDQFRDARAAPKRFFVITDTAKPAPSTHRATCQHVREEWVTTKVLVNGRRNGRYFTTDNYAMAEARGARACPTCRPVAP